jgi:soluble lytic murein transglycosylase-like protein
MFEHHRDLSGWAAAPIALAPLLLSLTAFTDPSAGRPAAAPPARAATVAEVESRVAALDRDLGQVEEFYRREVQPIEQILRPFHNDEAWVRQVALTLVNEGHRSGVDPRVLASVVLVEDPWLDPDIRSSQGAIGLMQVMPFHAGRWECGSTDLTDPATNVCHGARIFRDYMERAGGDLDKALLAYNGCVRGLNTPDCFKYPSHVYTNAGRAALRSWLGDQH